MIDLTDLDFLCSVQAPACFGVISTTGLGKSREIQATIGRMLSDDPSSTVVVFVPNHDLGREMKRSLQTTFPQYLVQQYFGLAQPDPSNPNVEMCIRDGVKELCDRGVPVSQLCGDVSGYCQHHAAASNASNASCAYSVQSMTQAQIWVITHASLFFKRPVFLGDLALKVIDESFYKQSFSSSSLKLDELEDAGNYDVDSHLFGISRNIVSLIKKEPDGYLNLAGLSGYCDESMMHALDTVKSVCVNVAHSSSNAELKSALAAFKGSKKYSIGLFWECLDRSYRYSYGVTPYIKKVTHDDGSIFLELNDVRQVHPSWQSPTVLLDATMPVKVNKTFFSNLRTVSIDAESKHVSYTQITDSLLSQTQFTRTPATYDRVAEILEFKSSQIPDSYPVKILVVCSQTNEREFKERGLPEGVETLHYGAVTGLNRYEAVPCIVLAGRLELPINEAEIQAARLCGSGWKKPLSNYPKRSVLVKEKSVSAYYHPDDLTEEIRRSWNEDQLIQAIGRGRAVRRTRSNPLDVLILTSVPLPLEPACLSLSTWADIQPSKLEVILSMNGIVPLGLGELQRHYPGTFDTVSKARTAVDIFEHRYPGSTKKTKVSAISSISNIYRQNRTYFAKNWVVIYYTPDLKNAKPTLAVVQKEEGESIQESLNEFTATKPAKKKSKKERLALTAKSISFVRTRGVIPGAIDPLSLPVQDTSYSIVGVFTGDGFELPKNHQGVQWYDPEEKKWTASKCSDAAAECACTQGRVYFQLKGRGSADN